MKAAVSALRFFFKVTLGSQGSARRDCASRLETAAAGSKLDGGFYPSGPS